MKHKIITGFALLTSLTALSQDIINPEKALTKRITQEMVEKELSLEEIRLEGKDFL